MFGALRRGMISTVCTIAMLTVILLPLTLKNVIKLV